MSPPKLCATTTAGRSSDARKDATSSACVSIVPATLTPSGTVDSPCPRKDNAYESLFGSNSFAK